MIPKTYRPVELLRHLDAEMYTFIQNDADLKDFLDMLGVPKKYRKDITGMVLIIGDGDIEAAWLCEDSRYYDLNSWYRPLPYWRPRHWVKKNLPTYWKEENPEYSRSC